MSLVTEMIARLQAIDPSPFALIEGAVEFASIDKVPPAVPAAYVFIKNEAAEENSRATGKVLQRAEHDIAVVIITSNVSDATGAAAFDDIEALKVKVRGALVGFVPESSSGDPLEYVSGQILRFRSGTVWFETVFAAASYIEEQS
ncbi:MAG: hypothetical protein CME90_11030 [Hoeflea sp.]|nr:hypothetical protein [Hoeflea sp.]|tara:strand:+ start:1353 stop:1787 length:435 start_codon:yes stop_codon:yes gene_type:complete